MVVTAVAVLAAPAAAQAAKKSYRAEIRRTTGGWAHVKARDYGSLGYGYGYAYAQDQLCELADIVTTVNAQRSRWFGTGDGNLESDFFYQWIRDARIVEKLARRRAPHGPSKIVRATVQGFVAGYNRVPAQDRARQAARSDVPRQGLGAPDHRARHVPALLRARPARELGQLPRGDRRRRPAEGAARARRPPPRPDPEAFSRRLDPVNLGSNAYGIGSRGARGERSLVLGNPHFPWHGSERWYEVHLTIPGKLERDRRRAAGRARP